MRIRAISLIKRAATVGGTTVATVVLALFGSGAMFIGQAAAAAPPPCASGYAPITNRATGLSIAGDGVNNPVFLETTGNCFKVAYTLSLDDFPAWEFQNGDGHCLWNDGGTIELGGACKYPGHPNEEFGGSGNSSVLGNGAYGAGPPYYVMSSPDCDEFAEVLMTTTTTCDSWSIP